MLTVTADELMLYCRVDDDAAVPILKSLADAAEEYLTNAGAVYNTKTAARYQLCVKQYVLHNFDNPTGGDLPHAFHQLVKQLQYSAERTDCNGE